MAFPDINVKTLDFNTPMEAVTVFLQESSEARHFFLDNREKLEKAVPPEGKWTAIQVLAHLNYWEDWMYYNRFLPLEMKAKDLPLSNWEEKNAESIETGGKSYLWLLDSWVARRKRLVNFLGHQEDPVWNWKAKHEKYGRTDFFFWVSDMIEHDCTHGKSLRNQLINL